jgi:alpha-galactosidase
MCTSRTTIVVTRSVAGLFAVFLAATAAASLAAETVRLSPPDVSRTKQGSGKEAVILTPKPPATPRINGAKVFGVRPGRPLLFTIPATGQRPMQFAVDNLPAGLTLDPQTGHIAGRIAKGGEYVVTLRAQNSLGEARRTFKVVCGDRLALTPHMGWNSWYIWENHVTDKIMREAAGAMVSSGLIDHGYMYVNIDDCWMVKLNTQDAVLGGRPRDAQGNINPNKRFPDMKALADYIHRKGLKAGLYTSPGPGTCGGYAGAYQHEAQDARQFAAWEFDFLKYDWCSYGQVAGGNDRVHLMKPYELMWAELQKLDRDIVFNLCQYGMGNVWEWGRSVGHSWRTAGDLGGSFQGIPAALFRDVFGLYGRNELQKYNRPGSWNDPDYLLLGHLSNWQGGTAPTPLSPNEQYAHVSLWCLLSAPLILSGDITRLDDFTLSLLSNDEVLELDQDPLGKSALRVAKSGDGEVWAKDLEDGTKAVGLFNRGESEVPLTVKWSDLGLQGKQAVRDLWRQKDLGTFGGQFTAPVGRHGVVLIRLRPAS